MPLRSLEMNTPMSVPTISWLPRLRMALVITSGRLPCSAVKVSPASFDTQTFLPFCRLSLVSPYWPGGAQRAVE